jgi:hypothetical protein
MHGRDAIAPERLDRGAFRALDLAPDDAEFGHRFLLRPPPGARIEPWTFIVLMPTEAQRRQSGTQASARGSFANGDVNGSSDKANGASRTFSD